MALSMQVMLLTCYPQWWCNWCHWCASGKKQGGSWERNCHHFSSPCNQCATTMWSWPSCCEVGYNRHLLHLPRGMQIYSHWDGDDAKDGNTCSLWWFSIDDKMWLNLKMLTDMETPLTNSSHPPLLTAMVGKSTCLLSQYNNLTQKICASFAVWLSILFYLILIMWLITTNICL